MRVLIVDDHSFVRKGLLHVLQELDDTIESDEASSFEDAVVQLQAEQCYDLVLLDISLGGRSGFELLQFINQQQPNLPVLIISMHPEEQYALRSIKMGAAGYLSKHSAPDELINAVQQIKDTLMHAPVLAHFEAGKPLKVVTDASKQALSATLLIKLEDGWHPVAYASRVLSKTERDSMSNPERECRAVFFGHKKFRPYTEGTPYTIETDHQALLVLKDKDMKSEEFLRWVLKLQGAQVSFIYRKGITNPADAPSRLTVAGSEAKQKPTLAPEPQSVQPETTEEPVMRRNVAKEQDKELELRVIKDILKERPLRDRMPEIKERVARANAKKFRLADDGNTLLEGWTPGDGRTKV